MFCLLVFSVDICVLLVIGRDEKACVCVSEKRETNKRRGRMKRMVSLYIAGKEKKGKEKEEVLISCVFLTLSRVCGHHEMGR